MKKFAFLALFAMCAGCNSNSGPPQGVVDDRNMVRHLEVRPPGSTREYVGLAVSQHSHAIAASWWRMKGLLAGAKQGEQSYAGFGEVRLPGFGESVVLIPHSYSDSYPWVAICDEASISRGGDGCAIKGNVGIWVAEVPIGTGDLEKFDAIVQAVRSYLSR